MNKQASRTGVLRILTGMILIAGFSSMAQAQLVVNMQVNDAEDKLTITTPGNCANGTNGKGCVKASGRQPVNFNLTREKVCSDGGNWSLDRVALGMSEGSVGNLTTDAASDFNADQASGAVTPNSQSRNSIQIRNNNTATYDVWYTVYAVCGDAVIDTDPRIENDGSGRQ